MAKRKSPQERLEEMDLKLEQLKAKKQLLASQVSQQERKARTKRLIETGAIFETHFGIQSKEDAEWLAVQLRGQAQKLLADRHQSKSAQPDAAEKLRT